jgi:hypothetical protein
LLIYTNLSRFSLNFCFFLTTLIFYFFLYIIFQTRYPGIRYYSIPVSTVPVFYIPYAIHRIYATCNLYSIPFFSLSHQAHLMTVHHELVDQMRADKPRASRNQNPLPILVRSDTIKGKLCHSKYSKMYQTFYFWGQG